MAVQRLRAPHLELAQRLELAQLVQAPLAVMALIWMVPQLRTHQLQVVAMWTQTIPRLRIPRRLLPLFVNAVVAKRDHISIEYDWLCKDGVHTNGCDIYHLDCSLHCLT